MNRRKNLDMVLAVCIFLAALAGPAAADTHYVNPGESIQAAIDDPCTVNGDEIVVAPSVYVGAINFNGKAITLRSTDPNDPSVVAATIIHGALASSAVTCNQGEGPNTVLDGFRIMYGYASVGGGMINLTSSPTVKNCTFSNNHATSIGGGMYNFANSSPTVTNCTFIDNQATNANGGGMYNFSSSPTVTDCNFSGNTAATYGGGMYNNSSSPTVTECSFIGNSAVKGGGMYNIVSSPTVTNCNFTGNTAGTDGGGMYNYVSSPTVSDCNFSGNTAATNGGGMCNYDSSSPTVTNCNFSGNTADRDGGGMYSRDASSPTVTNCTFTGNTASSGTQGGGGMYCYDSSPTVTNCTFYSNAADEDGGGIGFYGQYEDSPPNVTNCLFIENTAGDKGGGMCNSLGTPTVTNCTFIGNSAGGGGGGIRNYNGDPIVTNCILWGDTPDEIYDSGGSTATSYSDVQGESLYPGTGNINANPSFVSPAEYDLRLRGCSPCVDAGKNEAVPPGVTSDLDGNPRFVDDANLPDTGSGTAPIVDMGAYERQEDTASFNVRNITRDVNYCSIQSAIDNALPFDVIEVGPGTYDRIDFKWLRYITLYSTHGPSVTFIDAGGYGTAVTCKFGQGPSTVLEGFTITGGNATNGGGMYVMMTSPTVRNCTFTGNTADTDGGGMYNRYGNPTLTNCRFNNNTANCGGGMCSQSSRPTVTNCTFTGNTASSGNRGGGGMYCYDSSPTVTNCTFYSNAADEDGGGIGFYDQYSQDSAPNVTNCLFIENTAGDTGGGMCNSYGTPTVTNCTFIGNSAGRGGGGIRNYNGDPIVTNCILWGDTPDEIYDSGGSTVTSYSDVQGDDVWPGQGNIDADPLFVNPARGDLRLVSYRSPCIDAGDNSVVTEPNDLAGNPRVFDGDENDSNVVDMGAYEFNGGPIRNLRLNRSYLTIQAAIDDPSTLNGDKIEVTPGTYYESIDFHSESIHLYSSDGPQVTTIDGTGHYHVVQCISGEGPNTILEGFTITGGNANGSGFDGFGGGMLNVSSSPTVKNCTFSGNIATSIGGGMFNNGSSPTVTNCTFSGNSATNFGGGMYNHYSSPTVANCSFSGNSASGGGAMFINGSSPTLTNCTFTGNTATLYGGGISNNNSSPIVTNCILWGDTAPSGPEISIDGGSLTVSYSDVQGGWSGEGNIDENPLLRNVAEGDLSLAPWSPCIDAGNNAVVSPNATDITGLPRLVDGDCNTTVIVDMGAHEFRHAYGGDFDSSCLVNMADYAFLAWAWLASPASDNWDPVCNIGTPADQRIDYNDLKVLTGNWLEDVNTPITCDANRLKDEFGMDAVCAAAILSAAPCGYSPNDVAQALYDAGYSAAGAYQGLTQVCGMSDGFAIEQLLYNTGYSPEEYLESTALSFVRKFAPVLYFDSAYKGLPMSAQLYFNTMLYCVVDSMTETIIWRSATHGPCLTADCEACGTVKVCGRDTCDCGMSNGNFQTLRDGEIPTYYKVISDIDSPVDSGPKGRLRIAYWWFYGFQEPCNTWSYDEDGAHHGDWEHIIVTTDPDRTIAESVTYYFHKSWYTRWGFETVGDRPVVYVGKLAHGSYHSDAHSGWGTGTPYQCCDYADYRDSDTPDTRWYNCWENIVSLRASSEPWMPADRIGTLYEYDGNPYRIESWRWGPYLSYCYIPDWFFGCLDWERTYACGTHPTIDALDWDISSCDGVGCGADGCKGAAYVPPIDYDQGWPWD